MARHGEAWQGRFGAMVAVTRIVMARHGQAGQGGAWLGMAWQGRFGAMVAVYFYFTFFYGGI